MQAAVAAIEAGDYTTAERKAVAALGLVGALPKIATKSGEAGSSIEWTHESITELIKSIRSLRANTPSAAMAGSGGLVLMPLQFRRTST